MLSPSRGPSALYSLKKREEQIKGDTAKGAAPQLRRGSAGQRARIRDLLNSALIAVVLVVLIGAFTAASPYFLTVSNIARILQQVTVVAVLTVGQAYVIITAGIDLSQGSLLALSGICMALVYKAGVPIWAAIIVGLLVGIGVGMFNGILITRANLPPFIATLSTLAICGGGALIAAGGQPVFGLPASLTAFGSNDFGFLPEIAIVAIVMAVLGQFILSSTLFGRYTYAIGSNPLAARVTGIRVKRQLLVAYMFSGLCSAVGAVLLTAYVNGALPNAGTNYELYSIAAVVIGGGSLFGGVGTVWGSMLGALLITTLNNGTDLLGVSTYFQSVLLGVVVILAVYFDNFRRRPGVTAVIDEEAEELQLAASGLAPSQPPAQ